jgi:hypothetical protein
MDCLPSADRPKKICTTQKILLQFLNYFFLFPKFSFQSVPCFSKIPVSRQSVTLAPSPMPATSKITRGLVKANRWPLSTKKGASIQITSWYNYLYAWTSRHCLFTLTNAFVTLLTSWSSPASSSEYALYRG